MTRRNPLAVRLTTADVIRELRLDQADLTPEARREAARAVAAWMTPEQRRAVAERNADAYAADRAKIKATNALMRQSGRTETRAYGVARACPRCGAEARGQSDDQRNDWFVEHFNSVHGGH